MRTYHPDQTYSLNHFKGQDDLLVHSMFYTIQGEGPFAGQACVFLRLGGCNLGGKDVLGPGCEFCDTQFHGANSKWMSVLDTIKAVEDIGRVGGLIDNLLIITGGEPLLQHRVLFKLVKAMQYGWKIQMETNGTMFTHLIDECDNFRDLEWMKVHFVVSPKALGTGAAKKVHINPNWRQAQTLKFLISGDPASPYYDLPEGWDKTLAEWANDPELSFYISPIAEYVKEPHPADSLIIGDTFDREATARNYARAAELVMKHGGLFKLSLQTHLFIGVQ